MQFEETLETMPKINAVRAEKSIDELLSPFKKIFSEKLGTFKGVEFSLRLKTKRKTSILQSAASATWQNKKYRDGLIKRVDS